jgi:citronellyl-CoA synthetase
VAKPLNGKQIMLNIKEIVRVTKDFIRIVPDLAVKPPSVEEPISLASILEATVSEHSDRNMIIFEGRELSWDEFNALTNQCAHALFARGISRGDAVAVIMENRIEFLTTVFALQKIGAIAGLINNSLAGPQLQHCIQVAGSKMCLVGEEVYDNFAAIRPQLGLADSAILWVADGSEGVCPEGSENFLSNVAEYPTTNLPDTATILAGDTALYIFTSGTTGMPKAAKITHRRWISGGYPAGKVGLLAKPTDRFYLCLPLFHGTGFICGLGAILYSGASMFLRRKFSASEFWLDAQQYQTTCFIYVGELCRYLLAQPVCDAEMNNPLERVFGNGLRPDIWLQFKGRFAIDRVCEFYGSSEGNVGFVNALNKDKTMGMTASTVILVQYDVDSDEIVRDAQGKMIQVKKGTPGLLLGEIDERFKFDGYTNSEASEAKILRDVIKPGDAWFNTGDLVMQIDVGFAMGLKHYQFVDRVGDTFRWRSENVSTNEVGEILNANVQVELANVFGVDVPAAEGKAGMVSLSLKAGRVFDVEEFSAYVRQHLPSFAQPVFVRIQSEASTTGTFKLVKAELRKQAYHLPEVSEDIYVMPPRGDAYQRLDEAYYQTILAGTAGF